MSKVEISRAKNTDIDGMLALLTYIHNEDKITSPRNDEWKKRTKNFLESGIENDDVAMVVAREENTSSVVGCGIAFIIKGLPKFYLAGDSYGYIRWMAVDPEMRNQGIGGEIMRTLLSYFKKQKVRTLQIHAGERAKNFYERFGFGVSENENMWLIVPDES